MRRLRILLVTFDPPTGSGGIEGRAMAYVSSLVGRSVHVVAAALSPRRKESEESYLGTKLLWLSSSIQDVPGTFRTLVRTISQTSIDSVFFLSGGSTVMGILILWFSRVTGRKASIFFYGRDILRARRRPLGAVALVLSVLLAHNVAANSKHTAGLLPLKPRSPITIIYPGVDGGFIQQAAGVRRDERFPRILFVGRLIHRKGVDLLLVAFNRLRAENPNLRLDIVGDGPVMGNLRAISNRLGLDDFVWFHGARYGQELRNLYSEATLFVMPARQTLDDVEGFGTVFMEAAICGVPSIGTRTGGISEAVIDGVTGKLVNPEDVEGLTQTMKSLLDDPKEIDRLGRNAMERAKGFSWEASTNLVIGLFHDYPRQDL